MLGEDSLQNQVHSTLLFPVILHYVVFLLNQVTRSILHERSDQVRQVLVTSGADMTKVDILPVIDGEIRMD